MAPSKRVEDELLNFRSIGVGEDNFSSLINLPLLPVIHNRDVPTAFYLLSHPAILIRIP